MRDLVRGIAILCLVTIASLSISASGASREDDASQREATRIRFHFDSVLAELRGRDVSRLDERQRARRAGHIATLASYRDRGLFPHNYDVPGQRVPAFVDTRTGVRCAVGHLLETT